MSSANPSEDEDSLSPPVLVNESGADSPDEAPAEEEEEAEMPVLDAEVESSNVLKDRDLHAIFRLWEETHVNSGFDPVPILTR